MSLHHTDLAEEIVDILRRGPAIPAHPLALDRRRKLDRRRQRALSRYYIDAGVGGLAVGVHTTQFAIREVGLYEPVLRLAAETAESWSERPLLLIAGLIGKTAQAVGEARIAIGAGYHAGLLNVSAFKGASEDEVLEHCRTVAGEIPLIGFYLLPEVGGIRLSADFWRRFAGIDNVLAIKIAPFNRYGTVDVARGVCEAGAEERVTLLTGNDDHIVLDLLTPYTFARGDQRVTIRMKGGLLGHWAFWTETAVALLERIHRAVEAGTVDAELLALDAQVTDMNGAIYDGPNNLKGCIPGCLEVLRRQGLLEGIWCLDSDETMSPGQAEEIDRVFAAYPEFNDQNFVRANLQRWLADDAAAA